MDSKTEHDDDSQESSEPERICRYCLESDKSWELISPGCDCSGTSKYVHEQCLAEWIKTKHAAHLRLDLLQTGAVTRTLSCTECRGDYQIRISPVSWNSFFYRLLFDQSHQKLLQKMGLQIAWILFQSTTLSLVSKAFIKSMHQYRLIHLNNMQIPPNSQRGFNQWIKSVLSQFVNSNISFLKGIRTNIKLFFYYLVHPVVWVQRMVSAVIQKIRNMVMGVMEYILDPFKIIEAMFLYIRRFILFLRITFLFVLIVQHTASITFNANKLYHAFKRHKLNLVRLQILGQRDPPQ